VRYGRSTATDEEVENATRTADIHDRILTFPDGMPLTWYHPLLIVTIYIVCCVSVNKKMGETMCVLVDHKH